MKRPGVGTRRAFLVGGKLLALIEREREVEDYVADGYPEGELEGARVAGEP
jgi:hypothetical protein